MWWAAYKLGDWVFYVLGLPVREMPEHFELKELIHEIETDPLGYSCHGYLAGLFWPFVMAYFFYLIFTVWYVRPELDKTMENAPSS